MRLLLHICCAPCSIHPYKELTESAHSVTGFFYNPNIHPFLEYKERRASLEEYSKAESFPVIFHKYDIENFFRATAGNEEFGVRCAICWRMRLEETAEQAKLKGFDAFSTTLLVSPYQDNEKIKLIGQDISNKTGIDFMYKDFRPGFRGAQNKAKDCAMYRQKYCGCIFSEKERYEKKR